MLPRPHCLLQAKRYAHATRYPMPAAASITAARRFAASARSTAAAACSAFAATASAPASTSSCAAAAARSTSSSSAADNAGPCTPTESAWLLAMSWPPIDFAWASRQLLYALLLSAVYFVRTTTALSACAFSLYVILCIAGCSLYLFVMLFALPLHVLLYNVHCTRVT